MAKESRKTMRVRPLEAVLSFCIMLAAVLPAGQGGPNSSARTGAQAVVGTSPANGRDIVVRDVALAVRPGLRVPVRSAARALESLLAARGWEAGAAEYRRTVAGHERYRLIESEFISLGYRYLRASRVREAVTTLEIAALTFPQSSKAWEGLGEAYLHASESKDFVEGRRVLRDRAEACLAKSVELGPGPTTAGAP